MTDLPHLVSRIFNTPLVIQDQKLDTILSAIGPRILRGDELPSIEAPLRRPRVGAEFSAGGYLAENGIAVLPVIGTLVRRGSWLDSMSGMTSYAAIQDATTEILSDPSVRGLLLEIDSPGGEAGGCFDLVASMTEIGLVSGKPIWAHANDLACSGGYAIACAAESIWLPQLGAVGSVGVVTAHIDMSRADAMAGLKWTFITYGKHKVDGNSHEPLAPEVKDEIQSDIDFIGDKFVGLVAAARGMSVEAVRGMEANIFMGERAVTAGLADRVGTFDDALVAFGDHLNSSNSAGGTYVSAGQKRRELMVVRAPKIATLAAEPDAVLDDAKDEKTNTQHETESGGQPLVPADKPAPTAPSGGSLPPDNSGTAAVAAERGRCTDLSALGVQAAKLGVTFDVAKAIAGNVSVEAARKSILDAKASADEGLVTRNLSSTHTIKEGNETATVNAGFDRAIERQRKRLGLKA